MISVATAEQIINSQLPIAGSELVHFSKLSGRYLSSDVLSQRPQPPFDRVTMDGIAINSKEYDYQDPAFQFTLQGMQMAGEQAQTLKQGHCIEIMTGAVLPVNADCVVPVEHITRTEKGFKLEFPYTTNEYTRSGQHIHYKGSDHSANEILMPAKTKINATHLACLISAGYAEVAVKSVPHISIIMSGDELVLPGHEIDDFQIFASNAPALESLLHQHDFRNTHSQLCADETSELEQTIGDALMQSDIVITTGGVSMGKKDLLPQVFENLGVECHFHKVAQKPGKPFWFGSHASGKNKTLVFALPGNPVSSLVTARRYIIPALVEMMSRDKNKKIVQLKQDVSFQPELNYFLPVKIEQQSHSLFAEPVSFNTSGDTVALTHSDGFVELNANKSEFKAGEQVEYFPW